MIKTALHNWKTTSAGLTLIIGPAVHLVFAVRAHTADESMWTASLIAIVGGIGLIFAGDGAASAQLHAESQAQIADLTAKVSAVPDAITTGDTSLITKASTQPHHPM